MPRDGPEPQLHFYRPAPRLIEPVDRLVQDWSNRLTLPVVQAPLQQLPPDIAHFTGRSDSIEDALALLKPSLLPAPIGNPTPVVLAISGRAGVGKSALAIHIAHRLKQEMVDAQLYINLRGSETRPLTPAEVLAQFLRCWGLSDAAIPAPLSERLQSLQDLMVGKRTLMVLDNAADEAQVLPLIPAAAACAILITSRKRLVGLEGVHGLDLTEMTEAEAIELLHTLSGSPEIAADPGLGISAANLCSRLPLTLCLAGKLLRTCLDQPLEDYVAQLTEERKRVRQLHLSHPDVRVGFTLSYQRLDPAAARLLRRLGLLVDLHFTVPLAAALLESTPETAEQAIDSLVNLRLVQPVAGDRYRLVHDTIRLLARGQLAIEETAEDRQAARLRLSQWYAGAAEHLNAVLDASNRLQLALALGRTQKGAVTAIDQQLLDIALTWFETERFNLLAALEWTQQTENWDLLLRLAENLIDFCNRRRYTSDLQQIHLLALEAARHLGDRQRQAHLLNNLGNIYTILQNWDKAREHYTLSLEGFRQLDRRLEEAHTLINLGILQAQQEHSETAVTHWTIALSRIPFDSPDYRRLVKWMQSVDRLLWQKVAEETSNQQPARGFLQNLGSVLKRLIREE